MVGFTVSMSVYHGDNAAHFKMAVDSILNQSLKPDEIVLVIDGPVSEEINNLVNNYEKNEIFRIIRLEKNSGHAIARQTGLAAASNNYVAIMDSDDIASPDRFLKQVLFIEKHSDVDVLGGQIDEFVNSIDNIVGSRVVPLSDSEIKSFLKSRCPMNLVTVILKKDSVLQAGGYLDWYCEEDYYLWVRMAELEMKFANLPDALVKVRVGDKMYQRRGGVRYFKSEARLQKYMLNHSIISLPRFLYNVFGRFIVQVVLPNKIRSFVFQNLFRR